MQNDTWESVLYSQKIVSIIEVYWFILRNSSSGESKELNWYGIREELVHLHGNSFSKTTKGLGKCCGFFGSTVRTCFEWSAQEPHIPRDAVLAPEAQLSREINSIVYHIVWREWCWLLASRHRFHRWPKLLSGNQVVSSTILTMNLLILIWVGHMH